MQKQITVTIPAHLAVKLDVYSQVHQLPVEELIGLLVGYAFYADEVANPKLADLPKVKAVDL